MRVPTEGELLEVWERNAGQTASSRALALLALSDPSTPRAELEALPLGERDRRLLGLRAALLGPTLQLLARCPACSERIESTVPLDALSIEDGAGATRVHMLDAPIGRIEFRVPTTADLQALESTSPGDMLQRLLGRCVLRASDARGRDIAVAQFDALTIRQLGAAMECADAGASIQLDLACPACGVRQRTTFDIVHYLWRELDVWARRLLLDVHNLARAYGWSESQVLALSPTRRRLYLELVHA